MRTMAGHAFVVTVLIVLISAPSRGEVENRRSVGLMVGDPMAVCLRQPLTEYTFMDYKAGIWTWHFYSDAKFEAPFMSVDYGRHLSARRLPNNFYAGIGLGVLLDDSPKDQVASSVVVTVRAPLGMQVYTTERFTVDAEIAPNYQVYPWYNSGPYGVELNAGLIIRKSY